MSRTAVHAIAEMVLAVARYQTDGNVGLRPWPNGLATPPLGPNGTVFAIEGTELVIHSSSGTTRKPITTLGSAGTFVGVDPQVPGALWPAETSFALEEVLPLDASAAAALAEWYRFVEEVLARFTSHAKQDRLEAPTLWPEHFDLATQDGTSANYGGSPGDDGIAEPYLYVGPWVRPLPQANNPFWNQAFGASLAYSDIESTEAALAFLLEGRAIIQASSESSEADREPHG